MPCVLSLPRGGVRMSPALSKPSGMLHLISATLSTTQAGRSRDLSKTTRPSWSRAGTESLEEGPLWGVSRRQGEGHRDFVSSFLPKRAEPGFLVLIASKTKRLVRSQVRF